MDSERNYGTFQLELKKKINLVPASGATVQIARGGVIINTVYTNLAGDASVSLPAPPFILSQVPSATAMPYEIYDVRILLSGYITLLLRGVQIFPGLITKQTYEMTRSADEPRARVDVINIPPHSRYAAGNKLTPNALQSDGSTITTATIYPVPKDVVIPSNITIHMGAPSSDAENVTVPYINYLKSVASSEIYPTWPEAALRANILAQQSLALNRIYTEWYRSQGYDFDITSSPAYDQYYVHRRSTFETTDKIIDDIFTQYIARATGLEPIFARYCDGYVSQCLGLSQWGTVELANRYYTPLDILRYYYGENIFIKSGEVVEVIPNSYPGLLKLGESSPDVALLQSRLNRIAINYSAIPFVESADGTYNQSTANAVSAFQRAFGLTPTGEANEATWYRILYIYTAVKRLAESDSEGEKISNEGYPGFPLNVGDRGLDVLRIEFYLNRISGAVGNGIIPRLRVNGIYDIDTRDAVTAFQNYYGLPVSGVIDENTWNAIVTAYFDIPGDSSPSPVPYPGAPVRYGDRGNEVRFIQDALNTIGTEVTEIPTLTVDGVFGIATQNAVKAFQQFYGLSVDGIVGEKTWARLNEEYSSINGAEDVG